MTSIWTVRRSPTDAKLTGLCGGLAQHWGIDPVLVRLGFVLLALSGGIGVVLYIAGWLLIPVAGNDSAPIDDFFGARRRRWPKEVWISLVVVAAVVVFTAFGSMSPFGLTPAIILAIVWYFGFYKKRGQDGRGGPLGPARAARAASHLDVRYPGPHLCVHTVHGGRRELAAPDAGGGGRRAHPAGGPIAPATSTPTWPTPAWPTLPAPQSTSPTAYADPPPREPLAREAFFSVPDPVGLYSEPEPVPTMVVRRSDSPAARRLRLLALVAVGLTLAGLGIAATSG